MLISYYASANFIEKVLLYITSLKKKNTKNTQQVL